MTPRSASLALCRIFCVLVSCVNKGDTCRVRRIYSLEEYETAKHGKATIDRDGFRNCETAHTKGERQRCQRAQGDDRDTS